LACKRRCAFCFGLRGDATLKTGQLAHIDRNRANNAESNAAFLWLEHHDGYDIRPSQSKRLTKGELVRYRRMLFAHLKKVQPWTDTHLPKRSKNRKGRQRVSLDVYNARIPTYRTTVQFLRTVAKDLRPEWQDILKFARDTEEALFLFDETIAEYLTLLFRKAVRLHAVEKMQTAHRPPGNLNELIVEGTELALWFTAQYDEIRSRFAPFLKLANYSTISARPKTEDHQVGT
jgi:hypothetical protein